MTTPIIQEMIFNPTPNFAENLSFYTVSPNILVSCQKGDFDTITLNSYVRGSDGFTQEQVLQNTYIGSVNQASISQGPVPMLAVAGSQHETREGFVNYGAACYNYNPKDKKWVNNSRLTPNQIQGAFNKGTSIPATSIGASSWVSGIATSNDAAENLAILQYVPTSIDPGIGLVGNMELFLAKRENTNGPVKWEQSPDWGKEKNNALGENPPDSQDSGNLPFQLGDGQDHTEINITSKIIFNHPLPGSNPANYILRTDLNGGVFVQNGFYLNNPIPSFELGFNCLPDGTQLSDEVTVDCIFRYPYVITATNACNVYFYNLENQKTSPFSGRFIPEYKLTSPDSKSSVEKKIADFQYIAKGSGYKENEEYTLTNLTNGSGTGTATVYETERKSGAVKILKITGPGPGGGTGFQIGDVLELTGGSPGSGCKIMVTKIGDKVSLAFSHKGSKFRVYAVKRTIMNPVVIQRHVYYWDIPKESTKPPYPITQQTANSITNPESTELTTYNKDTAEITSVEYQTTSLWGSSMVYSSETNMLAVGIENVKIGYKYLGKPNTTEIGGAVAIYN